MANLKQLVGTMRPPFLVLTPICLFLAVMLASYDGYVLSQAPIVIMLITAFLAHVAVNTLNEYQDFKSGLDLTTEKTPFSGGSGTLPSNPSLANATLKLAISAIVLIVALGLYLALTTSLLLIPFGIAGVIIVISYTKTLNKLPVLCYLSPGVGFSIIMILGSYVAITGTLTPKVLWVALIPFFQVNHLLLLNQFPDVEADRTVGRNTFPIHFGEGASIALYCASIVIPFLLLAWLLISNQLPATSSIALFAIAPAIFAIVGAIKFGFAIGQHTKFLAANVVTCLLTPLLISFGLLIS